MGRSCMVCSFTFVVIHFECSNILRESMEKVNRCSQNIHIVESLLLEVVDVNIYKSSPRFPHLHCNGFKQICISNRPHFVMVFSYQEFDASWRFKWYYRPLSVDKSALVFLSLRALDIVIEIFACCHVCR